MSSTHHEAPPRSEAIQFRRDGDSLCVENATPVMWFARHTLDHCRPNPDVGLSFDGTFVTLHAANGQWVWKLTGRTRHHYYAADAGPVLMVEGVWPD